MFEANNITSPWSQGNYLTCVNKIIEPLGECRQEYDWLLKIAENLGLSEAFSEGHMTVEEWLKTIYENHRCQYPQFPEYEEFQRLGIVRLLKEEGKVAFRDRHFPTPSGKVEIYSELLKSYGDPRIPAIPCYVPEKEGPGREKEYPLQLVGWHSITRTHSVHDNNPNLQKQPQRIWMHEQDARERSLKEGSLAEVFNKRGKMRLNVHLTREIMPGTVALSQGAWYQPDRDEVDLAGSINVLTTLEASPLAHGNGQHTCLVEIKKWEKTT